MFRSLVLRSNFSHNRFSPKLSPCLLRHVTDVELDLATLGVDGRRQLAKSAYGFGLHATDFLRLLDADQQLETELRMAKALEEEKLQLAVICLFLL